MGIHQPKNIQILSQGRISFGAHEDPFSYNKKIVIDLTDLCFQVSCSLVSSMGIALNQAEIEALRPVHDESSPEFESYMERINSMGNHPLLKVFNHLQLITKESASNLIDHAIPKGVSRGSITVTAFSNGDLEVNLEGTGTFVRKLQDGPDIEISAVDLIKIKLQEDKNLGLLEELEIAQMFGEFDEKALSLGLTVEEANKLLREMEIIRSAERGRGTALTFKFIPLN